MIWQTLPRLWTLSPKTALIYDVTLDSPFFPPIFNIFTEEKKKDRQTLFFKKSNKKKTFFTVNKNIYIWIYLSLPLPFTWPSLKNERKACFSSSFEFFFFSFISHAFKYSSNSSAIGKKKKNDWITKQLTGNFKNYVQFFFFFFLV